MGWSVVLELEGLPPRAVGEYPTPEEAKATAIHIAAIHRTTGGKVTIAKPDSSDQLQRYSKGRWVRQEPDKPAVGEDATVIVPNTVNLGRIPR